MSHIATMTCNDEVAMLSYVIATDNVPITASYTSRLGEYLHVVQENEVQIEGDVSAPENGHTGEHTVFHAYETWQDRDEEDDGQGKAR